MLGPLESPCYRRQKKAIASKGVVLRNCLGTFHVSRVSQPCYTHKNKGDVLPPPPFLSFSEVLAHPARLEELVGCFLPLGGPLAKTKQTGICAGTISACRIPRKVGLPFGSSLLPNPAGRVCVSTTVRLWRAGHTREPHHYLLQFSSSGLSPTMSRGSSQLCPKA